VSLLEPVLLLGDDGSLELLDPCFLVFFDDEPEVLVSSEVLLEPVEPLVPDGDEPLEPLMPDEDEPLEPVPLPELSEDPVDEPLVLPEPLLPVPVVPLELEGLELLPLLEGELVLELSLGDVLLELLLGEDELLLDPVPLLPLEPADMMSSFFTLSVSPEPAKLART
jgi:hypothetical protein